MTTLGLRPRAVIPALDSSRSPSASCDELDARCAFPRFRLSTRKLLLNALYPKKTFYTERLFVQQVISRILWRSSYKLFVCEETFCRYILTVSNNHTKPKFLSFFVARHRDEHFTRFTFCCFLAHWQETPLVAFNRGYFHVIKLKCHEKPFDGWLRFPDTFGNNIAMSRFS